MFSSIGLTLSGFIFLSLIAIFYFSKKKYHTLENQIFTVLLIFTLCMLVLEFVCVVFMANQDLYPLVTQILCRSYILGVIVWCVLILIYLWILNNDFGYRSNKDIFNEPFVKIISFVFLVAYLLSCLLPITLGNKDFYVIGGVGVYVLYVGFAVLCVYMVYTLILNKNHISLFKRMPLFLFIIFLILLSVYQLSNFDFNDLTFLFAFCIIAIYFTIENPDIQLMEELEIANEKAVLADKEKTEFLTRMSHEIRTPINSIMGFSESILNESNLTVETLREDSKNINLAANSLLETIENILDISDIESGKEIVENIDYSMKDIVYELNSYVQSKISKDVEFVFSIDKKIPSIVNGDKLKIYKILYGILSNSIKFTKTGQIKLDIYSEIEKENVDLKFVISDTGIGIKEENLEEIFVKFSRLSQDSLSLNYNSTGLGLSIVKDLVELLDGKIKVESTYGVGTTFTVELVNKIVDKSKLGTVSLINYDKANYIDCSRYNVLLADDDSLSLKATKDLLKNFKFNIYTCKNGIECIEKIKTKEKFDMIMLDYKMPEMDGVEVINIIKHMDDYSIPNVIVALSDNTSNDEKSLCLREGFTDYLAKPLEYKALRKVVLKYFSDKKEGDK